MDSLQETYRRTIATLGEHARNFPWERREAYAAYLGQTFYFARMSTRLLALSGARFDVAERSLHERFVAHAGEERGHDVILLNDLKHLGYAIDDIPEFEVTAAFWQVQYYWIEHCSPAALFGYILLLEGAALEHGRAVFDRLVKQHGIDASRFFKVHTESDPEHVEQSLAQIAALPPATLALATRNLEISRRLYLEVLAESERWSDVRAARAVAR